MSSSPSPPDAISNADMERETETETQIIAEATLASSEESLQNDMPLTMAASVVLEHLPRDAHTALSKAGLLEQDKILLHFRPGPSTPQLPRGIQKYKMSSALHFDAIIKFLRKKLQLKDHESIFCYVNQVFAPGLDEGVGNLWRCFKTGEELVVSYCVVQSFG